MCKEEKYLRNLIQSPGKQEEQRTAGNAEHDWCLHTRNQPALCQEDSHHSSGTDVFSCGREATQAKCLQAWRKQPRAVTISAWYGGAILRYEVELWFIVVWQVFYF